MKVIKVTQIYYGLKSEKQLYDVYIPVSSILQFSPDNDNGTCIHLINKDVMYVEESASSLAKLINFGVDSGRD